MKDDEGKDKLRITQRLRLDQVKIKLIKSFVSMVTFSPHWLPWQQTNFFPIGYHGNRKLNKLNKPISIFIFTHKTNIFSLVTMASAKVYY